MVLIVYGSNDDVDTVNKLAQRRRRVSGKLVGEGLRAVDRDYLIYAGDVIMLRESAYQPEAAGSGSRRQARVENGTMGLVTRVDKRLDRLWVAFDAAEGGTREVMVDVGRLRAQLRDARDGARQARRVATLRLAYAGHPFPMQGATFTYVGSLWGHPSQRKEETYSGDTRAKHWLDVHIDRESTGRMLETDDERYECWAKRLSVEWHRVASITYPVTSGVVIAIGAGAAEPLPEATISAASGVSTGDDQLDARNDRDRDQLRRYRALLGAEGFRSVSDRSDGLEREFSGLSDRAVEAHAEAGSRALARLARARSEALRLARRRATLLERVHDLAEPGAELHSEARGSSRLRIRRGRSQRKQAARTQDELARRDEIRLQEVVEKEHQLYADTRAWMADEAAVLVRGVAAERTLVLRREAGVTNEAVVDGALGNRGYERVGAVVGEQREDARAGPEPNGARPSRGPEFGF
jgi:hypothetical protein